MIRSIIKRDGRVVLYDESKIAGAILKAMEAAGEEGRFLPVTVRRLLRLAR